ncbi:hypothetical protein [Bacillus sp. Marseille-P3800]|uniref:hypothetical protein n=1 Tax=Bacillus sp. Marseille-P3800 TaxID=2014782 RepID=UPI000C07961D|nr:hypothetical protein [Bacillus sp. Marseille-P3800]
MTSHNGILGGDFDEKRLDHTQALQEYVQAAVRKGRADAFGEIEEIRNKAYAEGFEAGREFSKSVKSLSAKMAEVAPYVSVLGFSEQDKQVMEGIAESFISAPKVKSAQAQRDEIVERAKADIEKLKNDGHYRVHGRNTFCDFDVNKKKLLVKATFRWAADGQIIKTETVESDPKKCFNAFILKAIALRRALQLVVPPEYLNAPQPEEVRVGDIVGFLLDPVDGDRDVVTSIYSGKVYIGDDQFYCLVDDLFEVYTVEPNCDPYIIDDSRETEEAVDYC